MSISVQNMAGDVINIDIFYRYRVSQLKNELFEKKFIYDVEKNNVNNVNNDIDIDYNYQDIHDIYIEEKEDENLKKEPSLLSRVVLFLNDEEVEDDEFVIEGSNYFLFIKEKPIKKTYKILKFEKDSRGGSFILYNPTVVGYDIKVYNNWKKWNEEREKEMEYMMSINNIDIETYEKVYEQVYDNLYVKINKKGYDKIRNELFDFEVNFETNKRPSFYDYYYNEITNQEVLNLFVRKFIDDEYIKFKKIEIVENNLDYFLKTL